MANGIDGHTPVSFDTGWKIVVAIVGAVIFVLTMKFTQDSQNKEINRLGERIDGLTTEVSNQRKELEEWKLLIADPDEHFGPRQKTAQ